MLKYVFLLIALAISLIITIRIYRAKKAEHDAAHNDIHVPDLLRNPNRKPSCPGYSESITLGCRWTGKQK